jgi:hypothetical protein
MTSERCGGFVIIDGYAWSGKELDSREVPHAHCVNCGWIEDPLIRANRMLMAMAPRLPLPVHRVVRGPLECSDSSPGLVGSGRSVS